MPDVITDPKEAVCGTEIGLKWLRIKFVANDCSFGLLWNKGEGK